MSNLRQKIKDELEERGALRPCARCGKQKFALLEEFATIDQQTDLSSLKLGGAAVPCGVLVCENCGNVSLHALGALGLMPKAADDEPEKGESNE